ncbi:tRNA-uridine aminocarboxypropyltransferase [Tenacibaculum sp. HL-MS23]|uniref:tRNA-uridine aminocarboxypropyltransferase n=1 Tax=Tenacibaculum sp. HL-MS23 TaxID=3077734 RepID=UPI0028FC3187|nr:tRNA-uridine aminocarboxypropyltransferase [Tenacibaculum sp. HL-MS23]WNW01855.1 tRNA-uridine aminocarboxypropyltransferase [Tenacibaculum sp. HL-MS23]
MQVDIKKPRIKCYTCMRPNSTCLCKHLNPFHTNTRFIILMHPKEYRKEKSGTGHITNLQLKNSEVIVGIDFTNNSRVNQILANKKNNAFLLYPGKDSFNISTRKSVEINYFMGNNPYIFILDGTWPCARKMLKLSTNLQQLKRVSFDNNIKSKFIIKQQPAALCLSTIESVYTVINLLNKGNLEKCDTKNFLLPFEKMIDHQLEYALNPNNKNDGVTANKEMITKNIYKKNTERNVIFEKEQL